MERLYSASCERNRDPILNKLKGALPERGLVLEVGSGTGQHAGYFGAALPRLLWQPSDVVPAVASIAAWAAEHGANNVRTPLTLDLFDPPPLDEADAIVCINTIHIAPWPATHRLFALGQAILAPGAPLITYGPYRYLDRPLEPSNQDFDALLRSRDPASGIRTFEDIADVAERHGFVLDADHPMPAHNHLLVWRKTTD